MACRMMGCSLCPHALFSQARSQIHNVTILAMHDNLLECCDKRGDTWASEAQRRLYGCFDLVVAEENYHANCMLFRFLLNKGNTLSIESVPGRSEDRGMLHWFHMLDQWLESEADAELYTLYIYQNYMTR